MTLMPPPFVLVRRCRTMPPHSFIYARVGAFTVIRIIFTTRLYNRSKRLYISIPHIPRRLLASPVRLSHQKIKENTPRRLPPLHHVRMKMYHFCKTHFCHFAIMRFYGAFSLHKNDISPPPTFKRTSQT